MSRFSLYHKLIALSVTSVASMFLFSQEKAPLSMRTIKSDVAHYEVSVPASWVLKETCEEAAYGAIICAEKSDSKESTYSYGLEVRWIKDIQTYFNIKGKDDNELKQASAIAFADSKCQPGGSNVVGIPTADHGIGASHFMILPKKGICTNPYGYFMLIGKEDGMWFIAIWQRPNDSGEVTVNEVLAGIKSLQVSKGFR